jgi:hypothetical protein
MHFISKDIFMAQNKQGKGGFADLDRKYFQQETALGEQEQKKDNQENQTQGETDEDADNATE